MKAELRHTRKGNKSVVRGIVLISENKAESAILDAVFGSHVGEDGLIGTRKAECRLADGYGEHYIYIQEDKNAQ